MMPFEAGDSRERLAALQGTLVAWLVNDAYPRWAQHGIDPRNGGFFEALGQNGVGLDHPRRARVHPRQIFAFGQARSFGWHGDVAGIVTRGMAYFTDHYRRSDGLFRTLAGINGAPLDDRALLYDQAFVLLGFAAAATALDARREFEARALALRDLIERRLGAADGSFRSEESVTHVRESNPHMHLLEACLAWADIGGDAGWTVWVQRLAELAVSRFIRADSGALGEAYTAEWRPAAGLAGRIIEPGHQFEWAWLLLRCEALHLAARERPPRERPPRERPPLHRAPLRETALRLLTIAEDRGVQHGVAVNQLLDDFSVHDAGARLWPQTERLRATLLAATLTGAARYWSMAHAAASSFLPYLQTPVPGLWLDLKRPNGTFADTPAPASTFYHLVGAIAALQAALRDS